MEDYCSDLHSPNELASNASRNCAASIDRIFQYIGAVPFDLPSTAIHSRSLSCPLNSRQYVAGALRVGKPSDAPQSLRGMSISNSPGWNSRCGRYLVRRRWP